MRSDRNTPRFIPSGVIKHGVFWTIFHSWMIFHDFPIRIHIYIISIYIYIHIYICIYIIYIYTYIYIYKYMCIYNMVYIDAHLVLAIPIAMLDETGEIMKQEGKRCFSYQQNPKPWHLAAPIWCIHQRPGSEASFGVTVVPCGKAAISQFLGVILHPIWQFTIYNLWVVFTKNSPCTRLHTYIVVKPEVTTLFIIFYQWKCMFIQIDPNSFIKCVAFFVPKSSRRSSSVRLQSLRCLVTTSDTCGVKVWRHFPKGLNIRFADQINLARGFGDMGI